MQKYLKINTKKFILKKKIVKKEGKMEKTEFYNVLQKLILPLFTGSFIEGEEISTARDSEVALGKKNSLLIKPSKQDEYRFILKRGQAFQNFEIALLRSILAEINTIAELNLQDPNYITTLQSHAIEKSICRSLCDQEETVFVMLDILNELEKWASRTYEGKKISICTIINLALEVQEENCINYSDVMNKDFFALLTDGEASAIEFDKNGFLVGYTQVSSRKGLPSVSPYRFEGVAKYCNDKRIGLVLTSSGDFLIFKNRTLLFAKRNGNWIVFSHDEVIQLLLSRGTYSLKDIRRSIYFTALDTSFAYTGGCLVYLNKDSVEQALTHIDAHDIVMEKYFEIKKEQELEEASKLYNYQRLASVEKTYKVPYSVFLQQEKCYKAQALRKIIADKPFHELNRKLRQELVSMDGATVIDNDGNIIAIGAIIKIEAGSEGGGRLAAAHTLAKYGTAIKISQDGNLTALYSDKKNGKIKTLFTVG